MSRLKSLRPLWVRAAVLGISSLVLAACAAGDAPTEPSAGTPRFATSPSSKAPADTTGAPSASGTGQTPIWW